MAALFAAGITSKNAHPELFLYVVTQTTETGCVKKTFMVLVQYPKNKHEYTQCTCISITYI